MTEKSTLQRIELTGFQGGYLHRINVPGGWLVLFTNDVMTLSEQGESKDSIEWRTSMTFYPDPEHKWSAGTIEFVPTVIKDKAQK